MEFAKAERDPPTALFDRLINSSPMQLPLSEKMPFTPHHDSHSDDIGLLVNACERILMSSNLAQNSNTQHMILGGEHLPINVVRQHSAR